MDVVNQSVRRRRRDQTCQRHGLRRLNLASIRRDVVVKGGPIAIERIILLSASSTRRGRFGIYKYVKEMSRIRVAGTV